MFDVVISHEESGAAAAATCAGAFGREGWTVFLSDGRTADELPRAAAHVVIWTQTSVRSARLARESSAPLENRRLLQVLLQPGVSVDQAAGRRSENVVEPPEPFCFHQGLPVRQFELDASERAIDAFAHSKSAGDDILNEVARLGLLKRPRDTWNATIVFSRPFFDRVEPVVVSEYAPANGRLLRRDLIDENSSLTVSFRTTSGNKWQVATKRNGQLCAEVVVTDSENRVELPRRKRWFR